MVKASDYHIPRDLLAKYAKPGPRYTSYPTAPVWRDFSPESAIEIYKTNNPEGSTRPLALYFHMPFCTSLCWYCGCNVKISRDKSVLGPYLQALETELELVSEYLASGREVSQMHWGGGTPTYLSPEQIKAVVTMIKKHIRFAPGAEVSIEVDPRVTTYAHLQALRECGFNRISMGVQDFNPQVQEAVHRVQSFEATLDLIQSSRKLGFVSVNVDLMYGLPFQTVDSFAETLKQVHELNPDRLALFHYAHVPWLKPAQKLIQQDDLPSSEMKLDIFELAIDDFMQRGYSYIGMDHFAKPDDELSQAQADHTLRRNFMGYTTQAGLDLYGFGVSSISEIDGNFIQNQRHVPEFEAALQGGVLPTSKGLILSPDDHLRKAVIEQLICNCYLDYAQISKTFGIDFKCYFGSELSASEGFVADGLITMEPNSLRVLPRGQILIRNICMIWDIYLTQQQGKQIFSRTV